MTDEELEKVARAARPEHDEDWGDRVLLSSFDSQHQYFIAAFSPATALALLERVRKAERPSHPTVEHSRRVVTALEEMLAPLSDGTLGSRDVVGRVAALIERVKELEEDAEERRQEAMDRDLYD